MKLPKKLYKYEKFSTKRLSSLKNQNIYFSSPESFNDPFDCAIGFSLKELNLDQVNTLYEHYKNVHHLKEEFVRKFQEPTDEFKNAVYKGAFDAFEQSRNKMLKERGVACFSEKVDDILMWSHYSDGHKGYCLEFDTTCDPFNHALPVEYEVNLPEINILSFVLSDEYSEIMKIFKTKYEQWEYEKEWRIFHDEAGKLYGYDAPALTGIYFGSEIPYSHLEILALILQGQNPNVNLYKMHKNEHKYSVYYEKVTYTSYIEAKKLGLA